MTIEREPDGIVVQCDTCLDVHDETFESFSAAIRWVQLSAWLAETEDDGETWTHRCTDCIVPSGGRLENAREMFGIEES